MSRRRMTKRIKTWSLVKVLTRSWSLENNTRKYQKCVSVTEINDVVSFFFFFFFFSMHSLLILLQTASSILLRKGLFSFVACLGKRIPELLKTCNMENILLYWKIFTKSLRSCDKDLYLNLPSILRNVCLSTIPVT